MSTVPTIVDVNRWIALSRLPGWLRLVLTDLAYRCQAGSWSVAVSVLALAKRVGICQRYARSWLAKAEELGVLRRERRWWQTNVFHLDTEKLREIAGEAVATAKAADAEEKAAVRAAGEARRKEADAKKTAKRAEERATGGPPDWVVEIPVAVSGPEIVAAQGLTPRPLVRLWKAVGKPKEARWRADWETVVRGQANLGKVKDICAPRLWSRRVNLAARGLSLDDQVEEASVAETAAEEAARPHVEERFELGPEMAARLRGDLANAWIAARADVRRRLGNLASIFDLVDPLRLEGRVLVARVPAFLPEYPEFGAALAH